MMPINHILTVMVGVERLEAGYAGWRHLLKLWGGLRDNNPSMYEAFLNIPFVRYSEETDYKVYLTAVIDPLREENLLLEDPSL